MYSVDQRNVSTITAEKEWNDSNEKEALMHTIHTYPAKFPAFIAQKAFDVYMYKMFIKYILQKKLHAKNFDMFIKCA